MEISPDTLAYVQTVKNFLKKNEGAKTYFLSGVDETVFYEHLTEIAEKNLQSFGDPTLSREQFDLLKSTMKSIKNIKKSIELENFGYNPEDYVYIDSRGIGKICLN